MKRLTYILVLTAALVGCKTKQADEEPGRLALSIGESSEEADEATVESEETEEGDLDMVISLEDIEKAAEAYTVLHDEDLDIDEKRAKFEEFLEDNNWAVDAYADLMYDIAQHSASRVYYIKMISK